MSVINKITLNPYSPLFLEGKGSTLNPYAPGVCNTPGRGEGSSTQGLKIEIPEGSRIEKNGRYLRIANAHGHPLAGLRGSIPFHRFVLYVKLGEPTFTQCHWCGFPLPWNSSISNAVEHVVCADHLDNDGSNNEPENLVPSCSWCNKNRNWAEPHPDFWAKWRRWMADVHPSHRPNLPAIAEDFGITVFPES